MKTTLFIIGLLLFISCKKEKSIINISGITETYANGDYNQEKIDKDDWNIDEVWTDNIHELFNNDYFNTNDSIVYKGLKDGIYGNKILGMHPAYPNPFSETISIWGQVEGVGKIKFVIVDEFLNVYFSRKDIFDKYYALDLNKTTDYQVGKLYRIYYIIESTKGIYYGHGDIQKD